MQGVPGKKVPESTEAPHPGEDEALLYFVQVKDELVFHGPAGVYDKKALRLSSQSFHLSQRLHLC